MLLGKIRSTNKFDHVALIINYFNNRRVGGGQGVRLMICQK